MESIERSVIKAFKGVEHSVIKEVFKGDRINVFVMIFLVLSISANLVARKILWDAIAVKHLNAFDAQDQLTSLSMFSFRFFRYNISHSPHFYSSC